MIMKKNTRLTALINYISHATTESKEHLSIGI